MSDAPHVLVLVAHENTIHEKRYENSYAVMADGKVLVWGYDKQTVLPLAIWDRRWVMGVEHKGEHRPHAKPGKSSPPPPPALSEQAFQQTVNSFPEDRKPLAVQMADAVEEAKKQKALEVLESEPSAEEREQDYLSSADEPPKAEPGSDTEAASGSDQKMLETPSGKFALRVPLYQRHPGMQEYELPRPVPAGEAVAVMFEAVDREALEGDRTKIEGDLQRLGLTGTSKPSRGGSRKHGSHGRPRQLPGATALIALALFLSVSFHRS